jgi:hypothetical protein
VSSPALMTDGFIAVFKATPLNHSYAGTAVQIICALPNALNGAL